MEKTCGNCGMFALEPFKQRSGACMGSFDRDTCTYHSTSIHRCEENCHWCSGWIPKQDPIEQSFQQLSEMAREMHRTMREWYEALPTEDSPNPAPFWTHLNEQLEELGVEV